jgi:hypothetical protein
VADGRSYKSTLGAINFIANVDRKQDTKYEIHENFGQASLQPAARCQGLFIHTTNDGFALDLSKDRVGLCCRRYGSEGLS